MPWNKGKHMWSKEQREEMSIKRKGIKPISAGWNKGEHHLEITKNKMSESHKGRYIGKSWEERYGKETAEHMRKQMSLNRKGKFMSKKTRIKLSNLKKGISPKNIKDISGWNKGNKSGINIECKNCGKEKYFVKSQIDAHLKGKFFCSSLCQYEYTIGKNHPGWKGGKSFEPYDEDFSGRFKREIRKRDNQICMNCGIHREKIKRALSVHHINYDKLLTIPENCISLCIKCHSLTNNNREYWTKLFQSILHKKNNYNYTELNEPIIEIIKENSI